MQTCEACGSAAIVEVVEGFVCSSCGVVSSDVHMQASWGDAPNITNATDTTDRSLWEDYRTLEYISQLFENNYTGILELAKNYAKTVRLGLPKSSRCKHKSYRGMQRMGVMVACWVCASREHKHEMSPTVCANLFSNLPNCAGLHSRKCAKYCADGRKLVETILSENEVAKFADLRKYERYMLIICTRLKCGRVHKYALRLLDCVEQVGEKGVTLLQGHTPENMSAALIHKASQVSRETFIELRDIVGVLNNGMGHNVCENTVRDICKDIETTFQEIKNNDEDIETLLDVGDKSPPDTQVFVTKVIADEKSRFESLLRMYNLG